MVFNDGISGRRSYEAHAHRTYSELIDSEGKGSRSIRCPSAAFHWARRNFSKCNRLFSQYYSFVLLSLMECLAIVSNRLTTRPGLACRSLNFKLNTFKGSVNRLHERLTATILAHLSMKKTLKGKPVR